MSTRYTASFEWDGEAPAVGAGDGWLGGRLVRLSFDDEMEADATIPLTTSQLFQAIDRGLSRWAAETGGSREFHEVVIDGRTYRTTSQKLMAEIQRQDLEIREMNGRLIAANRTLQNVQGQLATAHSTIGDYRVARGELSDDEANEISKRLYQQYGPTTPEFVRRAVEVADAVRYARLRTQPAPTAVGHMPLCPISSPLSSSAKQEAPDDAPGLADALGRAAVIEEEHRYLSSALIARCGPRRIGESWVDYARRTMGQS